MLINLPYRWAAVCISKNACTALKARVLMDNFGRSPSGKDQIHDRVGYSASSPFLHPVGEPLPRSFLAFAVWRDPVERFMSFYTHYALDRAGSRRMALLRGKPLEDWIAWTRDELQKPVLQQDEHVRRQTEYYRPTDVAAVVPLSGLCSWFLSKGWGELPRVNASTRAGASDSVTPQIAGALRELYAADYSVAPSREGVYTCDMRPGLMLK